MTTEIDVLTLFPAMVDGPLRASILGRALDRGLVRVGVHDIRDHGIGRHRVVDDTPYGGGPGMILRPEPVVASIEGVRRAGSVVVLLDPAGERLDQAIVRELAAIDHLVLVCPRYEGVDDRVRPYVDREISIGDYVVSGGELPALVVIDAVVRLLPGVIDEESVVEESHADGLLEYPQFTRPPDFRGAGVPDVLVSGDHQRVRAWRRAESIRRTARRRPDLLAGRDLAPDERALLDGDPADG